MRLKRISDALFGADEEVVRHGAVWRYLSVAALLVVAILVRRPDLLTMPQLLLEDGMLFFPQNLILGFPRALLEPYQGFPYLAHRVIALVGGLVPPAEAARVYVASSVLLTALGLAAFSLPNFRHVVRSDALRIAFGLAVLTLPLDNRPERTLGTVTNLGWLLAIWVFLSSFMRLPLSPWRTALVALLAALAALSTPLAVLCLPVWLLRLGRGAWRRDRSEMIFAALPLGALLCALLASDDLGARTSFRVGKTELSSDVSRIAVHVATEVARLVAPPDSLAVWRAHGKAVLPLLAFVVFGLIAGLCARERRNRATLLLCAYGFLGAVGLTMVGRAVLGYLDPLSLPPRYRVFPGAMLSLAALAAVDAVPAGRLRAAVIALIVALWTWARAPQFFLPPPPDLQWREQAPKLVHALRNPCPVRSSFRMQPVALEVVWGSRYPVTLPPAPDVVAALGRNDHLTERLDSQCRPMSEVSFYFSAPAISFRGNVHLDVYAADAAAPLASAQLPRAALQRGWATFCFNPAVDAAGGRYRLVLRTQDSDPAIPLLVMGAVGDDKTTRVALTHGCADRSSPELPIVDTLQGR